jgi:hypothetical protein
VASGDEFAEDLEESLDVGEVESGGGFVEDEELGRWDRMSLRRTGTASPSHLRSASHRASPSYC